MGKANKTSGFTLIELVIVMAVIAVVLGAVIPNLKGMQSEAQLTKVEGDLNTIKDALVSYWKNNENAYPVDIHAALVAATPPLIAEPLRDPFATDAVNSTYGYYITLDPSTGTQVWAVYSKGPKGDTPPPVFNAANARFDWTGNGRIVSNVALMHQ